MNEKDIQQIIDLAEDRIRETTTAARALQNLVEAGILDAHENYT